MADNVKLSAGTNDGAIMRSLATSDGVEYGVSALAYATTISPGANVLLEVSPTNRLPVAATLTGLVVVDSIIGPIVATQDTPSDLQALVSIAADQTLATLTSITNPVTIVQGTASNLNATVQQGGTWTVASSQSGTWNVGTVSTVTAVTSITNPVAVTQSGTWTVGLSAAQTLANVTTVGTITNPVAVTQSGTWNVGITGTVAATQSGTWNVGTVSTVTAVTGITNPVTVAQSNAANLLATVNIASAQTLANVTTLGTITNPVAVTKSGTWNIDGITNAISVQQAVPANLKATVSLAASQTLDAVTTITNPVGLAAGANLVGRVSSSNETSTLYNGTTALTPKFAKIQASSSGDNSIVALVSGKKIRVLRWSLTSNGTVSAKWRSNTTDLTGLRYLVQYASAGGAYCPVGIFETAAGEALNLNLSAAVAVGGELVYVEV